MTVHRFIAAAATAGMLAVGLSACGGGKSSNQAAGAGRPSPAASPSPSLDPAAVKAARADLCGKVFGSAMRTWDPLMEIDHAGTDRVKLKVAVEHYQSALDVYATDLAGFAAETGDAEFKAVILSAAEDLKRIKQEIAATDADDKRLKQLLNSDSFSAGQKPLETMCES